MKIARRKESLQTDSKKWTKPSLKGDILVYHSWEIEQWEIMGFPGIQSSFREKQ
jgi:hypothetical protein